MSTLRLHGSPPEAQSSSSPDLWALDHLPWTSNVTFHQDKNAARSGSQLEMLRLCRGKLATFPPNPGNANCPGLRLGLFLRGPWPQKLLTS